MKMETKYRAWDGEKMHEVNNLSTNSKMVDVPMKRFPFSEGIIYQDLLQFTGLQDRNGKDYYIGDIGKFDNGDTFVLKLEDWLEVFTDWIGEVECEDQIRDLYRIENAEIIGNIHENPELL